MKKTLYWLPRILGILFIAFISLFALDVFSEGYSFFKAILGFLIHLIPSYFLIAALVIAWKKEMLGGIIFIVLWIMSFLLFRRNLQSAIIFSPLILIGILFMLHKLFYAKTGTEESDN